MTETQTFLQNEIAVREQRLVELAEEIRAREATGAGGLQNSQEEYAKVSAALNATKTALNATYSNPELSRPEAENYIRDVTFAKEREQLITQQQAKTLGSGKPQEITTTTYQPSYNVQTGIYTEPSGKKIYMSQAQAKQRGIVFEQQTQQTQVPKQSMIEQTIALQKLTPKEQLSQTLKTQGVPQSEIKRYEQAGYTHKEAFALAQRFGETETTYGVTPGKSPAEYYLREEKNITPSFKQHPFVATEMTLNKVITPITKRVIPKINPNQNFALTSELFRKSKTTAVSFFIPEDVNYALNIPRVKTEEIMARTGLYLLKNVREKPGKIVMIAGAGYGLGFLGSAGASTVSSSTRLSAVYEGVSLTSAGYFGREYAVAKGMQISFSKGDKEISKILADTLGEISAGGFGIGKGGKHGRYTTEPIYTNKIPSRTKNIYAEQLKEIPIGYESQFKIYQFQTPSYAVKTTRLEVVKNKILSLGDMNKIIMQEGKLYTGTGKPYIQTSKPQIYIAETAKPIIFNNEGIIGKGYVSKYRLGAKTSTISVLTGKSKIIDIGKVGKTSVSYIPKAKGKAEVYVKSPEDIIYSKASLMSKDVFKIKIEPLKTKTNIKITTGGLRKMPRVNALGIKSEPLKNIVFKTKEYYRVFKTPKSLQEKTFYGEILSKEFNIKTGKFGRKKSYLPGITKIEEPQSFGILSKSGTIIRAKEVPESVLKIAAEIKSLSAGGIPKARAKYPKIKITKTYGVTTTAGVKSFTIPFQQKEQFVISSAFKEPTQQKEIIKTSQKQLQPITLKSISEQNTNVINKLSQKPSSKLIQKPALDLSQKPMQKMGQKNINKMVQRMAQKTIQKQSQKLIQRGTGKLIFAPRITPRITETPPIFPPRFKPIKQQKVSTGKFPVYLRRFGKFKIIGFGKTPGQAVGIGKRATERTLAATFKVPKTKPFKIYGFKTKFEKEGQVYIEKIGRRLKRGSGEVEEIHAYRQQALKGSIYA